MNSAHVGVTIFFGGRSRERLVSAATAQALASVLPEAELWFWHAAGQVRQVQRSALLAHLRPFETAFTAKGALVAETLESALDAAAAQGRVLVMALHGGECEDGRVAALCEARGLAFTGSGSRAGRLAFDKAAAKAAVAAAGVATCASLVVSADTLAVEVEAWRRRWGRLAAKPVAEGSSYGLVFVETAADAAQVTRRAQEVPYLEEPFLAGREASVAVVERNGRVVALPTLEIAPEPGRSFDYAGKYLGDGVREFCPGRFSPEDDQALKDAALTAHLTLGARGYSRSDFIVTEDGPVFLELNTLPGLTMTSLFPIALRAAGLSEAEFLAGQIEIARRAASFAAV